MADKKFECNVEGCDQPHCRKCGRHYEPCKETERAGGTCDRCLIYGYSEEARIATEACGGNSEEAARLNDW